MSLDRDISLLKTIGLFNELSTEQLRLLAFSAVRQELGSGQVLFREGSRAMSGFIVASGKLELSRGEGKAREAVGECEPGSLIGEVALFVENRRAVTATSVGLTEVLEIDRKLILRMLNEYPHVALRIRATLADRLKATIADLSRVREALGRVERRPARRRAES